MDNPKKRKIGTNLSESPRGRPKVNPHKSIQVIHKNTQEEIKDHTEIKRNQIVREKGDKLEDFLFGPSETVDEENKNKYAKMVGEESEEESDDGMILEQEAPPAWEDDDDVVATLPRSLKKKLKNNKKELEGTRLEEQLRDQREKTLPEVKWASQYKDSTTVLQSTNSLIEKSQTILPKANIRMTKLKDANYISRSEAPIRVKFHPTTPIVLCAGDDTHFKLFEVDGEENEMLTDVVFENFPIKSAQFTPDGTSAILCGLQKYFFSYDMVAGKIEKIQTLTSRNLFNIRFFSQCVVSPDNKFLALKADGAKVIAILDNKTRMFISEFVSTEKVSAISFSSDSQHLYTAGKAGKVLEWDMGQRRCSRVYYDEGMSRVESFTESPKGLYQAIGSDSGIVNLYEKSNITGTYPKPVKSLSNLTTPISHLRFNHDNQILAFAADGDGRLLHTASRTVFKNFTYNNVHDLDFSFDSSRFAVAHWNGTVALYQLNHYAKK